MSERARSQSPVLLPSLPDGLRVLLTDTTAAIQSFVYHTMQHPDAWRRIRAEIDAAQASGMCRGRVVAFRDAEKLPYLRACIKEALRMFSPTTMSLPRVVPKGGLTIAGRHFREGTTLSVSSQ